MVMMPKTPARCRRSLFRSSLYWLCARNGGNVRWAAAQDYRDLAVQIEPRQIVVLQLGDGKAVTDEYQRRLGPWRRVEAHADDRVLAKRERPALAAAHQFEA